jgi:hypothetical protein
MFAIKDTDIAALVPVDQLPLAQQQVEAYWSATWYDSLLGAVERSFTLPAHLAFSILVLQVFLRRQLRWLWFSVAWHALLNAITLFIAGTWNIYLAELALGILAFINIGIIFKLRQPEPVADVQPESRPTTDSFDGFQMPSIEENTEHLDRTRYQE